MQNIETLLEEANIGEITQLIITCVDPSYPVSSLGVPNLPNVYYTDNSHPFGGHVQIAPQGFIQLFLKYTGNQQNPFERIEQDKVNENLPNGVIQIAYNPNTKQLVMGIPGDVYAFMDSPGFAFGKPNYASGQFARLLLEKLITNSGNPQNIEVIAMMHPDCGLYAHNTGINNQNSNGLKEDGSNFISHSYGLEERTNKLTASSDLHRWLTSLGVRDYRVIQPNYVQREPGILKALHGSH